MIQLSSIFGDYMVLQRDTENLIWGYSDQKSDVIVIIKDNITGEIVFDSKVTLSKDGLFELALEPYPAGGDFRFVITDADDKKSIDHITFGDVFICGGQSNMELPLQRTLERYEEEIKAAYDEDLRYFHVPEKYNFHHTEDLLEGGEWKYDKYPDNLDFGAVPYFAAVEIRKNKGVPVGIINTAIGGTPIKSWCCEETIRTLNMHVKEFEQCQDDEYVAETIKKDLDADMKWREEANRSFDDINESNRRGTVLMPGFFEDIPELAGKQMAIYMHKEIEVPASFVDQNCKLYLGALIDSDMTYLNGELVGETGYLYPPRIYRIAPGTLKEGTNRIDIKLLVFREQGGFMPGMHYMLKAESGEEISLEGEWSYEIAKRMPYLPNMTFFSYKATGVYNGMIYPLRRQKHRGIFFYQGESNIEEYRTYKMEFEACIRDWRKLWNDPEMPFIFVQLASWCEGKSVFGEKRACLAEEQRKCTHLPKTALVQAHDLGEYNELHPTNKKEVGRRIALAADDLVYGESKYVPGPEYIDVYRPKDQPLDHLEVEVTFNDELILSHGYGVIVDKDRDEENIRGFFYIVNGQRHVAEAEFIEPNKILLMIPKNAEAISYAWADSCTEANLYSKDRLPVVPFLKKRNKLSLKG
ncbi:MAG: hypothetical protein J5517_07775 [Eubacterium sp.]|nr:hypothetical protein [Eubacterium sp.]